MDINDSETLKWRRRTYSGQSAVTVGLQLAASTVGFCIAVPSTAPSRDPLVAISQCFADLTRECVSG